MATICMTCQNLLSGKMRKTFKMVAYGSRNPGQNRSRVFCTSQLLHITKTCLYNFDPLKPHFYVVTLGFTGVCIIFLNSAQKHRSWVRGGSNENHNLCFEQKYEKYQTLLSGNFHFFGRKIFSTFE